MVFALIMHCIWKLRFFRNIENFQFGIVLLTVVGIILLVLAIPGIAKLARRRNQL